MAKTKLVSGFYTSGGQRDDTMKGYFNMPDKVFRNGQWVNINANNALVFAKGNKEKAKKVFDRRTKRA